MISLVRHGLIYSDVKVILLNILNTSFLWLKLSFLLMCKKYALIMLWNWGLENQPLNSFCPKVSSTKHIFLTHPSKMVCWNVNTSIYLKRHELYSSNLICPSSSGVIVLTATYLINRFPSKLLSGCSPYELLYSAKPDYSIFKPFGCLSYICTSKPHQDKISQ